MREGVAYDFMCKERREEEGRLREEREKREREVRG